MKERWESEMKIMMMTVCTTLVKLTKDKKIKDLAVENTVLNEYIIFNNIHREAIDLNINYQYLTIIIKFI